MPPKPSAASCLLVPDPDVEAGLGGHLAGLVGQPGGVLQVGGHGRQDPGAPAGAAEGHGPVEAARRRRDRRARPARCARRAGARAGVERQWKPNEPSIAPTTKALEPVVVARSRRSWWPPRRDRAPPGPAPPRRGAGRGRRPAPTPTSSTKRRSALSGPPSGTGTAVTSPALPGRAGRLEERRAGRARACSPSPRRPDRAPASASRRRAAPAARRPRHRRRRAATDARSARTPGVRAPERGSGR